MPELLEGVNHDVERISVIVRERSTGPMMGRQALTMPMLGSMVDQIAGLVCVPLLRVSIVPMTMV